MQFACYGEICGKTQGESMPNEIVVPGGLIPDAPMMNKQTYASRLSYVGAARRIWPWARKWGNSNRLMAILAWNVILIAVPIAWIVVTGWYLVSLLIFWWFLFPFRLIRRSHRKQEQLQRQQLATMQAMMIQQQEALQEARKS